MRQLFQRFVTSEDGVTAIEYGLIASLIAVACIPAFATLGTTVSGVLARVNAVIG